MISAIVVTDYRDFESWKRARFAVCSVLDFTKSFSRLAEHRRLARDIDQLSVSILNYLAKGFEGSGDDEYFKKALESVDLLDRALRRASDQRALTSLTSERLQKELRGVRRALQRISGEASHNEQS